MAVVGDDSVYGDCSWIVCLAVGKNDRLIITLISQLLTYFQLSEVLDEEA